MLKSKTSVDLVEFNKKKKRKKKRKIKKKKKKKKKAIAVSIGLMIGFITSPDSSSVCITTQRIRV